MVLAVMLPVWSGFWQTGLYQKLYAKTKGGYVRINKTISKSGRGTEKSAPMDVKSGRSGNSRFKKPLRIYGLLLLSSLILIGGGGIVYERGLFGFSGTTNARASLKPEQRKGSYSKLPVPRFVSLKTTRINVRRGPGKKYAIQWVFNRRGLPVEIIAEFENWRRVRDSDGEEGWVFHSLLSGARMVTISPWTKTGRVELSEKPSHLSKITAFMEPGVMARVNRCSGSWCSVVADKYDGWVAQNTLWGVYPGEIVN